MGPDMRPMLTTATTALTELAEKGDIDVLRHMAQFTAQRLMELDVEGRCASRDTTKQRACFLAVGGC
jgi:putative transposase